MGKDDIDKARKISKEQVRLDIAWLVSHAQGRRFVRRFFLEARKRPFSGEQTHLTAYAEGRMDLAREVLEDLRQADVNLYQSAEREALTEEHHV